jgi:hypothetical protein
MSAPRWVLQCAERQACAACSLGGQVTSEPSESSLSLSTTGRFLLRPVDLLPLPLLDAGDACVDEEYGVRHLPHGATPMVCTILLLAIKPPTFGVDLLLCLAAALLGVAVGFAALAAEPSAPFAFFAAGAPAGSASVARFLPVAGRTAL